MLTKSPLGEHTTFANFEILGKFWTTKVQVLMPTESSLGEHTTFGYFEILGIF